VTTSNGSTLSTALEFIVVLCAMRAAAASRAEHALRRPWAAAGGAVLLWLVVAIPSLAQRHDSHLLSTLQRNPHLIRHHHQWYRLITYAVTQDGGTTGTVFNLVLLAVVAVIAAQLGAPVRTIVIFALCAVGFASVATWVWPTTGAGNSGATLGLAASVVGIALTSVRLSRAAVVLAALCTVAAGVITLLDKDEHGAGILIGFAVGLLWPTRSTSAVAQPTRWPARQDAARR
jgi:hypothetical protein